MITLFYIACLLLVCLLSIAAAAIWLILHNKQNNTGPASVNETLSLLPNHINSL